LARRVGGGAVDNIDAAVSKKRQAVSDKDATER
jgi:hypothetical protein